MGALHDWAKLRPEEIAWAGKIGLPGVNAELQSFTLPCSMLVDRKCSIFEQRPQVCPSYRCRLLLSVDSGSVELPTALARVEIAHELYRLTMTSLTGGSLAEARHRARFVPVAELLAGSPEHRDALLRERLHVTALDVFIDRHFRKDDENKMYKAMEDGGSGEVDMQETGEGDRQP